MLMDISFTPVFAKNSCMLGRSIKRYKMFPIWYIFAHLRPIDTCLHVCVSLGQDVFMFIMLLLLFAVQSFEGAPCFETRFIKCYLYLPLLLSLRGCGYFLHPARHEVSLTQLSAVVQKNPQFKKYS